MAIYSSGNLLELGIVGLIAMIVSVVLSAFSPFGIVFAIFSIVRANTKSSRVRTLSFVFQIIVPLATLLIGLAIGILLFLRKSNMYLIGYSIPPYVVALGVIFGVFFVAAVEIFILTWQSISLRQKASDGERK
jgi:hypothetical protein